MKLFRHVDEQEVKEAVEEYMRARGHVVTKVRLAVRDERGKFQGYTDDSGRTVIAEAEVKTP
jgi:hypothetical protein